MFADTFISAGPIGAIAQGKKDFLEKVGQARLQRKLYQKILSLSAIST
jgi:hypothetical protein